MGDAPAKVVPVRLTPGLLTELDARAKADNTSRSETIRRALARYLETA